MPMTREEKSTKARARRAAKTAPPVEPTVQPADTATDDADAIRTMLDNIPSLIGSQPHDGHFIDPVPSNIAAERLVDKLLAWNITADTTEHDIILSMIDVIVQGHATPSDFVECYAAKAAKRMNKSALGVRKSELKGVLTYAIEDQPFMLAITSAENATLNLQGMYKLRRELIGPVNKKADKVVVEDEPVSADSYTMSPIEVLLQQLANAQDAAADAGFDDIVERLRTMFYEVKTATVNATMDKDEALV
jgi:hypothetical protein